MPPHVLDAGGPPLVKPLTTPATAAKIAVLRALPHLRGVSLKIRRFPMPQATHTKAAEHHENAAKSHRAAAEHHGKGDQAAAHQQSTRAHEHSSQAHKHSDEARK